MLTRKEIFVEELVNAAYTPTSNYRQGSDDDRKHRISSLITTTPMISHYQDDAKNRQSIKKAFRIAITSPSSNGEPSENWFDTDVKKVFWFGWAVPIDHENIIDKMTDWISRKGQGANLDDYSAVGYLSSIHGRGWQKRWCRPIGFEIDGVVTYACKQDAWSNEGNRIHSFVKKWWRQSSRGGVPRRPAALPTEDLTRAVVLGPEDTSNMPLIGELIVTKWIVTGIIIDVERLYGQLAFLDPNLKTTIDWFESLGDLYPEYNVTYINDDRDKNPYWVQRLA